MLQRSLQNSLSCGQLLQQRTAFAASGLHPSLGVQCQARHAVCAASRSKAAVQSSSTSTKSSAAVAEPSRGFLDTLSEEQKAPVYAQEQHIRVIAGPGSGKTRTVIARVIWLLKQGVPSQQILAITFTRKAAGELQERLKAEFGRVPRGLDACTFHSFCTAMLRKYQRLARAGQGLPHWTVAEDEDITRIITDLLTPKTASNQKSNADNAAESTSSSSSSGRVSGPGAADSAGSMTGAAASSMPGSGKASKLVLSSRSKQKVSRTSSSSSSSTTAGKDKTKEEEPVDAKVVDYYHSMISAMKNFIETTHRSGKRKAGTDVIQELQAAGVGRFKNLAPDKALTLANVYDGYNRKLRREHKMDFDDILHHCLALVHNHPEVRDAFHRAKKHILVDEGQDTNLCQFELVSQITGPDTTLTMVGDPDQAIYGFRGARSDLLQQRFSELYQGTSATYLLSDNYRSRPAIIRVADMIRQHGRLPGLGFVPGRSKRSDDGTPVQLLQTVDQFQEADCITEQLEKWRRQGYQWDQMAVLCRAKNPLKAAYRNAVAAGFPAHIQIGDLWESIEVKAVLALLRAVVYPAAAGEGLRRRIISTTSTEVKVLLTSGLGPVPINALDEAIGAQLADTADDTSGASSGLAGDAFPSTLGSCLLAGCGLGSLDKQQAADVWQEWQTATSAGEDPMVVLQRLAPTWQQLAGLKALTRKQQAGLNRLRGLVQLATAAATLGQPPGQVLQLLLEHSGILPALEQSARGAPPKDLTRRQNRLKNMQVLQRLAGRAATLQDDADLLSAMDDESDADEGDESDAAGDDGHATDGHGTDSSTGHTSAGSTTCGDDGIMMLQRFVDLWSLQGDGDDGAEMKPRVQFMTMHASKGKEYGCVVLMSFYDGVLPSDRATDASEFEQERNVAYVGVTRAKDHLLISWPGAIKSMTQFGWQDRKTAVSSFLTKVRDLAVQDSPRKLLEGVEFTMLKKS